MNIHENLKQICNLLKKNLNDSLEDLDLTFSQSGILMYILMNDMNKINQRNIEKEFDLSNPTVNGILNRLECKGFIKRVRDNSDKRVKNIVALENAKMFMDNVKLEKEKMDNILLKNIAQDELDVFCDVIRKMVKNLKEYENERNI